jgi:hypothetical protein
MSNFVLKTPARILFIAAVVLAMAGLAVQAGSGETGVRMAKQLRHIVCFKFRDGVAAGDREKVVTEFCALQKKIPGIVELEWGTNSSPEKLNKGLTHCFILTFASDKDRDQYLVDPAHLEFVKLIKQYTNDAMVLDFWPMNSNP